LVMNGDRSDVRAAWPSSGWPGGSVAGGGR